MGRRFQDDLVAGLGVGFDRQLVGHGPGGNKKGLLFAQERRDLFLEGVDRGVFPEDVVADLGLGHGPAHGGGGFGDGVASQIDSNFHETFLQRPEPDKQLEFARLETSRVSNKSRIYVYDDTITIELDFCQDGREFLIGGHSNHHLTLNQK